MPGLDTNRGLRLLSLDGGGIRGLSELLIIEEIMKRLKSQSDLQNVPRPAEYFDLIGGTSTGGLIAILLGRLGLSAGEAIEVYTRLAERIFSEKKWKFQDGTFKSTILEEEMKLVEEKLGQGRAGAKMMEDEDQGQGCKMFVCATPALNVAFRRRFRNYHVRRHEAYNCAIWEAGRATSAVPTFFKRIEIDGEEFIDAGLGCNNPIKEVISEAQLIFGKEKKVECIVSIGTGKAGVMGFDKPTGFQTILPLDLLNVLKKMATESSSTAEEMEQRYEDATDFYFRFDVDQGLQDVGLDEWKQLGAVKTHTVAYTMETNVNKKIDAVVGTLTGTVSPQTYSLVQLGGQVLVGLKSAIDRPLEPTSNVPFLRDLDFVDRGDIMVQISDICSSPGARVALLGLGGIGKSQLAIEYAHRVRDECLQTWVFWVHASNQARMEEGFEQIAEVLDIPGRDDHKANIFQLVGQGLKDVREKWLLVVDNADDPIMFSRLARGAKTEEDKGKENAGLPAFPPLVTPHLPQTQNGSILVTSRNEEASIALVGEDKNIIHVSEMDEKESLDLLFKKLNTKVDLQGAPELVNVLEHIPLAITQAAAFLSREKGRISISQYVKDFNKSNKKKVRLLKPEITNIRRDDEAVDSIVATWQISFDHIRQTWPTAAEMLSLMSFFNYQGTPEFLLHDCSNTVTGQSSNEDPKENLGEDTDEDFEKRLRILRDYCLVSLGENVSMFRMHRLVQASTQDWLPSNRDRERLWCKYVRIVSSGFPAVSYENWERCRLLLPHIESVRSREPSDEDSAEDWARILNKTSKYKQAQGEYKEAEEIAWRALEGSQKVFGEEDTRTLTCVQCLARILHRRGKLEEAEIMSRRSLEGRRKLLGENHPHTLTSASTTASVLCFRGKYEEAETLSRMVVETLQKQLSKNHRQIVMARGSLAQVLACVKKFDEAEKINRQMLEEMQEAFQEDHPEVIASLRRLAGVLDAQGKGEEAEEKLRLALERGKATYGMDHPAMGSILSQLGLILLHQQKYNEAEKVLRQSIEEYGKVAAKLDNSYTDYRLAQVLQAQRDLMGAEQLYRRATEGFAETLGGDHPKTVECIHRLERMVLD